MLDDKVRELRLPGFDAGASLYGGGRTVAVLGHGAGGNRHTPMLPFLAEAIAASGRAALLYDFPYAARRSRRPDPPAVLEAAVRAAGELALTSTGAARVVHGGRSMGGRIASQAVAAGMAASGLLLLAYPLHPPGQPDRLRTAHLARLTVPLLFVRGTRDVFSREDLIRDVVASLAPRAELETVADADHSFALPKRSGRTEAEVFALVSSVVLAWLDRQGL